MVLTYASIDKLSNCHYCPVWTAIFSEASSCPFWPQWYTTHRLDEIIAGVNSDAVWLLTRKYAPRESLKQHERGRRMLLEQDMAI